MDSRREDSTVTDELPEWAEKWVAGRCGCGSRLAWAICYYCGGHLACAASGVYVDKCPSWRARKSRPLMADTNSLDLDALQKLVDQATNPRVSDRVRAWCLIELANQAPALIAELRGLRSQLAESQRENAELREQLDHFTE